MAERTYEPHIMENPALPFIFHLDHAVYGQQFYLNWHDNIEILYCISGHGILLCEANEYPFSEGDLCAVNTNELHAIDAPDEAWYYCLIVDQKFCAENGVPTDSVHFKTVTQNSAVLDAFRAVVTAYEDTGPCRVAKVRRAVLDVLIALREHCAISDSAITNSAEAESLARVKRCMVYICQHFSSALTLDEISRHVGISKYYLAREFKRITGQTIFTYLNIVRCKEAKRLILSGMPVSAAAVSSGFENMSYFTRMYKKCTGQLPSKSGS